MENNNIDVSLNKIPLKVLLDALEQLYEMGADYIDIIGVNNIEQDTIALAVKQEYMCPEYEEGENSDGEYEEYEEEEENTTPPIKKINIKLSDEDLNQLL
jgi:hypothetical protein